MGGETFPSPVAGPISLWLMNRKVGNVLTLNRFYWGIFLTLDNYGKFHGYTYPVHYDTVGIATKIWLCYPHWLGNDFLERMLNFGVYRKIYRQKPPSMPTFQTKYWKKFSVNYLKRGFGNETDDFYYLILAKDIDIFFKEDKNSAGD